MKLFLLGLSLAGLAAAQTVYVGSATQPMLAGMYAVAPGALVVVRTWELGDLTGVDPSDVRLTMQPRNSSQAFPVSVLRVEPHQVWAVVPPEIPLGRVNVTLAMGMATATGSTYITVSSFSLFASMKDGEGPAIAQNQAAGGAPVTNKLTTPAVPGDYVTLWGTGLGPFTASDVSIAVYDTEVKPTFAGHAPGMPGVDQINFRLPENVATGCYVSVTVTLPDDDISNQVALAIAPSPGMPCKHPLGLSAEQLKTLDQGGSVIIGALSTVSTASPNDVSKLFERHESAYGYFVVADAQHAFTGLLSPPSLSTSCRVTMPTSFATSESVYTSPTVYADVGPSLLLAGPENRAVTLAQSNGEYWKRIDPAPGVPTLAALAPATLSGASWTLSAAGAGEVAAFDQPFTMAPTFRWIDRDTLQIIDRNQDLAISWDTEGGSMRGTAEVWITAIPGSATGSSGSTWLSCTREAQTGRMVIPREWLRKLAVTDPKLGSLLYLTIYSGSPERLKIPLKSGGTAPVAISRTVGETIPIVIQ